MKRLISFVLAIAMVLSLSVGLTMNAFADGDPGITAEVQGTYKQSDAAQDITIRITPNVSGDYIAFDINNGITVPDGWTIVSMAPNGAVIEETETFNPANGKMNYAYEGAGNGIAQNTYYDLVIAAPAGAAAGEYVITLGEVNIYNDDYDDLFLDDVTFTVTINEADDPGEDDDDEETEGEYTVSMPADTATTVDGTVSIPVTVAHSGNAETYNAFDIVVAYDTTALTLTSTEIPGLKVTVDAGTVRVQGYGADRNVGTAPFTLAFKANKAGATNVTLSSAKVDISANALTQNAPDATMADDETQVTVNYSVILPSDFTGETYAVPGQSYTFTANDPYYNYTFSATMGDSPVSVIDNGDGTFTIPNVSGNIVVIVASETPKQFNVTFEDHKDGLSGGYQDLSGENQATYKEDYIATLTKDTANDKEYTYEVSITIDGVAYTKAVYDDETGEYTINGNDITGDIVFTVKKTELEEDEFSVTFEGDASGDADGEAVARKDEDYTFTVNKADGYTYTVTATMGGDPVEVAEADGVYTIEAVTGELVITVSKQLELTVEVDEYVTLNEKTMFLVTATTEAETTSLTYDGAPMLFADQYNAWSYLVIVEKDQSGSATLSVEDAKAMIELSNASQITVAISYDVNGTGVVDINDAQLAYDMYNAVYGEFDESATMQKYLRADASGNKSLDTDDAAAIVGAILRPQN